MEIDFFLFSPFPFLNADILFYHGLLGFQYATRPRPVRPILGSTNTPTAMQVCFSHLRIHAGRFFRLDDLNELT